MINKFSNTIQSDWGQIENAKTHCSEFLNSKGFSTDVIDTITMVVGELLENAIKYGSFENEDKIIEYELIINKKNITIEVINPTAENNSEHMNLLDKSIQWIRGYQNTFEAYIMKLKEISIRALNDSESCLGLVRIAYEGQSILDFYVSDDNKVHVSAIYYL